MPAYFSMCFTCEKRELYPGLVRDFCESLRTGGFVFLSGYWGCEEDSFEDIVDWNQKKLSEDFEPGVAEHFSRGYKQMMFEYVGYSEVRMYVSNSRDEDVFSFTVILPEDELICFDQGVPGYHRERIGQLERLCERIWMRPYVRMVQTELELSEPAPSEEQIRRGEVPGAEPFAILPQDVWAEFCGCDGSASERNGTERYVCRKIGRNGVSVILKGVGEDMSDNTNRELKERIIALIEEILEVPAGTITQDTLIEDVEEWDSLKHVEIIGALEEELSVNIPLEDALELQSMNELLEKAGCL